MDITKVDFSPFAKYLKFLVIFLVAYLLGRWLSPMVSANFVEVKEATSNALVEKVTYRGAQYEIDVKEFARQLPEKVKMRNDVEVEGLDLSEGEFVEVLGLSGEKLSIRRNSKERKIDPKDTDISFQLAKVVYRDEAKKAGDVVSGGDGLTPEQIQKLLAALPNNPGGNSPGPGVAQPVQPNPVNPDPVPEDPTPADPDPVVNDPEPAAPTPVVAKSLSEDEIKELMKTSLKDGMLEKMKAKKVRAMRGLEKEEFDGVEYEVGEALIESETLFGIREVSVKALIKEGKIEKWIWTNSGVVVD